MKKILFLGLVFFSALSNAALVNVADGDLSDFGAQARVGSANVVNGDVNVTGNYWADVSFASLGLGVLSDLSFDFKTDNVGEIHSIGFASSDSHFSGLFFQLGGTQTFGVQDYRQTLTNGDIYSFNIDLSAYDLTVFDRLVFVADQDLPGRSTNSVFMNLATTSTEFAIVNVPAMFSLLGLGLIGLVAARRK